MLPQLRALLAADATANALLAGRVYRHGEAPQGVAAPYVTWSLAGGAPENGFDGAACDDFRVQVDCWSDTDAGVETLASAVRAAIEPAAHLAAYVANGKDAERYPSPVGNNSHGANVRQLLRFYLLLEQGNLVSPAASKTMREIFESPKIEHSNNKFVKGLAGRDVQVIRKSGTWENWLHDTAVVTGGGRHYVLIALTEHPEGDAYLEALAPAVDDLLKR